MDGESEKERKEIHEEPVPVANPEQKRGCAPGSCLDGARDWDLKDRGVSRKHDAWKYRGIQARHKKTQEVSKQGARGGMAYGHIARAQETM